MATLDEKVRSVEEPDRAPSVDFEELKHHREYDLAKQAAEHEHRETVLEALRRHPKAVFWSVLLSTSIIMDCGEICTAMVREHTQ